MSYVSGYGAVANAFLALLCADSKRLISLNDPQAKRVYAWEKKWLYSEQPLLEADGAQKWVDLACEEYGIPSILTGPDPNPDCTISNYWVDNTITLAPKHMNAMVCLHEAAHGIHSHYFGFNQEAHGATWLGIYVHLLCRAKIAPRIAITASLDAAGLQYRKTSVKPTALKKKGPYQPS